MRQVWVTRHGGPDVLEVREALDPQPGPGEVRIRVAAAGVNFADVMIRIGIYPHPPKLPAVIGYEVAGVIDAVGKDAAGPPVGARVLALLPRYGGYSEAAVVPAGDALVIPDALSFEQAAAVPVNYLTAWLMLVRIGNVQPGERVLVHGAAGGVGQAAVQICRWRGAQVIGTASAAKHARLKASGVAHCIDYRTEDFEHEVGEITAGQGVDVVLDPIGGKSWAKSQRCLAPLGRLCLFGASSMVSGSRRNLWAVLKSLLAMPRFKPLDLMEHNHGVFGLSMGELGHKSPLCVSMLGEILQLVRDGQLTPEVDRVFPFAEAGDAHSYLQRRQNFGKVILAP
ncbi:MAG: zinc-binding dehydrogenase [Planctomycetaceae bacterium]